VSNDYGYGPESGPPPGDGGGGGGGRFGCLWVVVAAAGALAVLTEAARAVLPS
jgi:hypothetical protein